MIFLIFGVHNRHLSIISNGSPLCWVPCVPDHHVQTSIAFRYLTILQPSASASQNLAVSYSRPSFTSELSRWSPQGHSCLCGSSPVAHRLHLVYSNSAENKIPKKFRDSLISKKCCPASCPAVVSSPAVVNLHSVYLYPTRRAKFHPIASCPGILWKSCRTGTWFLSISLWKH